MLNYIFAGLILFSFCCAVLTGNINELSNAALSGAGEAITLLIKIGGMIMLWNGLMKIAEESGLVKVFSKLLSPLVNLLFPDLKKHEKARALISMNMSANMLGLGNAATPLGIQAMQELKERAGKRLPSRSMIMLVVVNTASIQLIPMTVAAIRTGYGSETPFDILPAVWAASICALICGVLAARVLGLFFDKRAGY